MRVILICATTIDGFIAKDSNEITRWTKDLALFKKQTRGCTVIVGSKTYKTIQNELNAILREAELATKKASENLN